MPVAKHVFYARSRSRAEPPRQIHGPSFARARVLPQQASSPRPAIAAVSVAFRSILRTAAQLAEFFGDILVVIASWILMEILVGCIAYAVAMYGVPEAAVRREPGEPKPSASPTNSSKSTIHAISVDTEGDIKAGEILSRLEATQPCAHAESAARFEQTSAARSGRCAAIIAPMILLLSKIRARRAWRRDIAELQSLDDRSLSDIGISRTDIRYIASHGARPE